MSAYLVHSCPLTKLARYACDAGLAQWPLATGQMLRDENSLSLRTCYREDLWPELGAGNEFHLCTQCYESPNRVWNHVAIIKACDNYAYQACEHPGWEDSEACKLIERIRKFALAAEWERQITSSSAYKTAPWGADSCHAFSMERR